MLNDFKLDSKSIHRLSSKGLSMLTLKTLLDGEIEFNLELWRAQGLNIVKHRG